MRLESTSLALDRGLPRTIDHTRIAALAGHDSKKTDVGLSGLRVLILSEALKNHSAGAQVTHGLAQAALLNGWRAGFVSQEPLWSEWPHREELMCYRLSKIGHAGHLASATQYAEMCRAIDDFRPDIVHVASMGGIGKVSWTAVLAGIRRGVLVVNQPLSWVTACMSAYFYRRGHGMCRLCEGHRYRYGLWHGCGGRIGRFTQWTAMHLQWVALRRVALWLSPNSMFDETLLRCGVSRTKIMRSVHAFNWDRVSGCVPVTGDHFLFHAQNREEKGYHLLPGILRRCPGISLVINGGSPKDQTVAEKIGFVARQVGARVKLPGAKWLPHEEAIRNLATCRAVLLPSVGPPFGELSVYESMAMGKPVVAFDLAANSEMIQSGIEGFLASPGDVDSIAAAVRRLHECRPLAQRMGEAARRRAKQLFGPSAVKNMLNHAYKRVLSGRPGF